MKNALILIFILLSVNLLASNHKFSASDETKMTQELNLEKVVKDVELKTKALRRIIDKKVQRKLFGFTEDLIVELVHTSSGVYYESLGKEVVTKNFENLTPEQTDVLNFLLLANAASELDRKNALAEEDSLRLELYRDRRDKLYSTLAKISEIIADVSEEDIKHIS